MELFHKNNDIDKISCISIVLILSLMLSVDAFATHAAKDTDCSVDSIEYLETPHVWIGDYALDHMDFDGDMRGIDLGTVPTWLSSDTADASAIMWADIDGDTSLELVVANVTKANVLYDNSGGSLMQDPFWIANDDYRSFGGEVADVDLDGDLDFASANKYYGVGSIKNNRIYFNINGILESVASWTSTETDNTTEVVFGDIDSDGDLDMIVANNEIYAENPGCRIYRNNDGVLEETASWSSNLHIRNFDVVLIDIENDGDLDILTASYEQYMHLYLNDGEGNFSSTPDWVSDEADEIIDMAVGDVNGDGYIDVATCCYLDPTRIHFNNNGTLETTASWSSNWEGYHWGVAFGDADNDGDFDLAIGTQWMGEDAAVFENVEGTLTTTPVWVCAFGAMGGKEVAWGDYDRDGDLDLAVGVDGGFTGLQFNRVYTNNATIPNTNPLPPTVFNTVIDGNTVTLKWNQGSDAETDTALLTYNLRVGTSSGGNDIFYAEQGPNYTHPYFGSCWHTYSKILTGLAPGTYYWSVQTVDAGFQRSNWSVEDSIVLGIEETSQSIFSYLQIRPNPFRNVTDIRWQITDNSRIDIVIYDVTGRLVKSFCHTPDALRSTQITWDGRDDRNKKLPSGVYFLKFSVEDLTSTKKLLLIR